MMNEVVFEANPSPRAHIGGAMDRVIARQAPDVRITLGTPKQAVIAPVSGWLSESRNSVFVLDRGESQARRRAVKIRRRNPRQAEILSGLEPGDQIITTKLSHISSDILNIR